MPSVTMPEALQRRSRHYLEQYLDAAGEKAVRDPEWQVVMQRVWAGSDFVAHSCIADPALLADLVASGDLQCNRHSGDVAGLLEAYLADVVNEDDLKQRLRRFRRREMVRIAWRDLARWAALDETLEDLSALADACVGSALQRLETWLRKEWGTPRRADGREQGLVVLGMGKLGARELNFSSDIDLIFAYAEEGQTRKRNGLAHEEFFLRLGRQLIDCINDTTSEGFVFRVDMRLRPYGNSGALALGFDALEEYYQYQGREWERYAMIKARVIAGDHEAGEELQAILRPFVYRRYLDFGVFDSLREMKAMIQREVRRKGMDDNIKLGRGGIREIEFLGQAFQLLRGGREASLRTRPIMRVLQALVELGYLPASVVQVLLEAYVMFRHVENRLQAFNDQQTHMLPHDDAGRVRLAWLMGYDSWPVFIERLARYRQLVDDAFEQFFAVPQAGEDDTDGGGADLHDVWMDTLETGESERVLSRAGFDDPGQARALLQGMREGRSYQVASQRGKELLDRLMPLLLAAIGQTENAGPCLLRVVNLLERILGRTTYLSLLLENPMALSQLVRLCAASEWIAEYLTEHPILLDELLDPRALYEPPAHEQLAANLHRQLAAIDEQDLEAQMDVLRQFKQSSVLQVAASDISGALPVMEVSLHLSMIAGTLLNEVLQIAWRDLVRRHGLPSGYRQHRHGPGFGIVAYGKLGGLELGYGSDLDLVFLHDNNDDEGQTSGPSVVNNSVFFARLGQRIIHILNAPTTAGVLYEVDMRLRPSGASGLLVSSLEAYADYQKNEAWTWEHQALVRARFVAGDPDVGRRFDEIRKQILCLVREPSILKKDVIDMRERMRTELGSGRTVDFDIKQDRGGVVDIEFIVQYLVLREAPVHPGMLAYTDNIRLLDWFGEQGILTAEECGHLSGAYRAYLARLHQLTLQSRSKRVGSDEFRQQRQQVSEIWDRLLGT